jgi:hypothetical protein
VCLLLHPHHYEREIHRTTPRTTNRTTSSRSRSRSPPTIFIRSRSRSVTQKLYKIQDKQDKVIQYATTKRSSITLDPRSLRIFQNIFTFLSSSNISQCRYCMDYPSFFLVVSTLMIDSFSIPVLMIVSRLSAALFPLNSTPRLPCFRL